jgi:hypothetical protein
MKVYVIHENPDWYAPLGAAFDAAGVPHEQWLLGDGVLDLDSVPPDGVFWSRMSASAHTRGHPYAKDLTRGTLCWLESHGRRVVNGRRVLELEMSKMDQLTALRAAGFDVPRTVAVAGPAELPAAARKLPVPFISKHNQGGKGLGVRLFESHDEFDEYLSAPDTARGGFELCPADACAVGQPPGPDLFALRDGFAHPITGRYTDFARDQGIEIAGFEFIETEDGRMVTYDVNTTTNYNAAVEAVAPRPALPAVAGFLGGLLAGV